MSTITAILPDQAIAEQVTDQLTALQQESIDWRLIEPADDPDRILPALGSPLGITSTTAGLGPAAIPVQYDYPEREALRDEGVPHEEAAAYGRSVQRGGIAIIIETPTDYADEVRRILEEVDAQQIAIK